MPSKKWMKPKKSANEMRLLYVSKALSIISEESSPAASKKERSNKHILYLELIKLICIIPDTFKTNKWEK